MKCFSQDTVVAGLRVHDRIFPWTNAAEWILELETQRKDGIPCGRGTTVMALPGKLRQNRALNIKREGTRVKHPVKRPQIQKRAGLNGQMMRQKSDKVDKLKI